MPLAAPVTIAIFLPSAMVVSSTQIGSDCRARLPTAQRGLVDG
jgi:hypothetical protein